MYRWLTGIVVVAFLAGCGGGGDQSTPSSKMAKVTLTFGMADAYASRAPIADIKKVTVTISGSYMVGMNDTFDFDPSTTITRTYQVPIGIDRLFHIDAFDVNNKVIYKGETIQDVVAGTNTVTIDLYPTEVFGQVKVNVGIPNIPTSLGPIYGFCFSPYMDGQDPNSRTQISEAQIRERLNIIKPWCQTVRSFGCSDGLEKIGPIAKSLGFYVIIGVWLGTNQIVNQEQVTKAIEVARAGGCDAISVGSEVLLRGDLSPGDVNSTPGDGTLIGFIKQVKDAVDVPVSYADIGSVLVANPAVCAECEGFILANFYPYWGGIAIDKALTNLKGDYQQLANANPGKDVIVGETGWPTGGSTIGQAVPNPANARRYFMSVTQWARENNVKIYWFEAFDEKWKAAPEGPQGANWGIFDSAGVMKPCYREILF